MRSAPSPLRHILVAVAGQTPAIITETLWALEHDRGIKIDEIRIITTSQGQRSILSKLLGRDGAFSGYCRDYGVIPGRIAFSEKSIYILSGLDGIELEDIRSSEDNLQAADEVFSLIRQWTKRRNEVLYCSVAGGRKTLGIYLTMALMLCGRPEDSLSHVLVAPPFETGVPDFFYPPPEECLFKKYVALGKDGEPLYDSISSDNARVELADIPFPKLREAIGGELPLDKGLTEAISHSQLILSYLQSLPPVILRLGLCQVELGSLSFHLSKQLLAVYAYLLIESKARGSGTTIDELFKRRSILAQLERSIDRLGAGEQEIYAWEKMRDLEDFRARFGPCISKINRSINAALGRNSLSMRLKISKGPAYGVSVSNFEIVGGDGKLWKSSRQ